MNIDIQEYILDFYFNDEDEYYLLDLKNICKHWNNYIYNKLYTKNIYYLNKYINNSRYNICLNKDSIICKKLLYRYVFSEYFCETVPEYECIICKSKKNMICDYRCCEDKIIIIYDIIYNLFILNIFLTMIFITYFN